MPLYALEGISPEFEDEDSVWIAPDASIVGRVRLGRDVSVWFGKRKVLDLTQMVWGGYLGGEPSQMPPVAVNARCTRSGAGWTCAATLPNGVARGGRPPKGVGARAGRRGSGRFVARPS